MTYWKCNSLQMFRAQSMQMSMWSHGIALSTFYLTCPLFSLSTLVCICLCLHLCITVIYLSISLEVTGSVGVCLGTHWEYVSLCYFVLFFIWPFLFQPLSLPYLFPIFWILLSTLSSLSMWKKIHCFINSVLYLTTSVTTSNSETSCISNCSLVKKKDKSTPSNSFLSFCEKVRVGWQQQC